MMRISFFDIQNFRKLKQCRITLGDTKTIFVGANNSGKTSAMDALGKFLANRNFVYNDITLSNRYLINSIGNEWENNECEIPKDMSKWEDILPSLDIWINVAETEIQYVAHIIPTLKWRMGLLGVRFLYHPKDVSDLFTQYREAYAAARETEACRQPLKKTLWPINLCDFLEKKLTSQFSLKAYILDPEKYIGEAPQKTIYAMECISQNPLLGLIKIDFIDAQRGFSDPEHTNASDEKTMGKENIDKYGRYEDKLIACYATYKNPRIFNQQSAFTVHNTLNTLENLNALIFEKSKKRLLNQMIIPSEYKKTIFYQLCRAGISHCNVFPDIEHLAMDIKMIYGIDE